MFKPKPMLRNEALDDGAADGMTGDDTWKGALPDDIQTWNEVKEAKSPDAFWDQMKNMRSFIGQSIRVPTNDASKEDRAAFNSKLMEKVPDLMPKPNADDPEQMAAFYSANGRPDEAAKYNAPDISAPDGIILQEGMPDMFKDIAHRYGLSQKQYEGVVKDYSTVSAEQAQVELSAHQEAMKGLTGEWGVKYDANMEKAEAIRSKYFADVVPSLNMAGADTVKAFANIAERFGPEGAKELITETQAPSADLHAPEEAQLRLDEILGNPEHAYWNKADPGNAKAIERVVKLTSMANPSMSTKQDAFRSSFSSSG